MHIIGTAGHVDHGKSTLVLKLTGTDPDRFKEEKERGLTIDLGFASLTLPSGREVSIVDVPGHEKFVKNMLAGIGGIDVAMLVVAGDESVMPQTQEHLDILDLLEVRRGLAVLTKRDLLDDEMEELVHLEVEEVLRGTSLEGSSLVAVSATTGQGMSELVAELDRVLNATPTRADLGRPRLAVDRSFVKSGFGTVVTGTLIDGSLSVGQEVEVLPGGLRGRIRGLQTHQRWLEVVQPGVRVAVNLGGVPAAVVQRGKTLAMPGWLRPTRAVDASIRVLRSAPRPVRHNLPVAFYAHSMETSAKIRLLDREVLEPGRRGWAQLVLDNPLPLVQGDRFIIRSPELTIGGGEVMEVHARRHRRHHAPTLGRLKAIVEGSPADKVVQALAAREPSRVSSLALRANLSEADTLSLARTAVKEGRIVSMSPDALGPGALVITASGLTRLTEQVRRWAAEFHYHQPLRQGMPREELRNRLGLSSGECGALLHQLAGSGQIVEEEGGLVRLPGHRLALSAEQRQRMHDLVEALKREPFVPPPPLEPELVALLVDGGLVVRGADGVLFAAEVFARFEQQVRRELERRGRITLAEVRDLLATSRRYALAVLERLDETQVTRRVGDGRVLRRD